MAASTHMALWMAAGASPHGTEECGIAALRPALRGGRLQGSDCPVAAACYPLLWAAGGRCARLSTHPPAAPLGIRFRRRAGGRHRQCLARVRSLCCWQPSSLLLLFIVLTLCPCTFPSVTPSSERASRTAEAAGITAGAAAAAGRGTVAGDEAAAGAFAEEAATGVLGARCAVELVQLAAQHHQPLCRLAAGQHRPRSC